MTARGTLLVLDDDTLTCELVQATHEVVPMSKANALPQQPESPRSRCLCRQT